MTLAATFTLNLLVLGAIRGLMIALIAMGIVLVYRSTRVINFAVGDLGIPSAARCSARWPERTVGRIGRRSSRS